jgi:hypothetical protein
VVSRYHWLSQGINTDPLPSTSVFNLLQKTYTIPAGGILKKFLLHNVQLGGLIRGTDDTYVPVWNCIQLVKILTGPNANRIIYRSGRRVPCFPVAILSGVQNKYSTYVSAGDLELGIDQKCSYGLASDTSSWTVQVTISMSEMVFLQNPVWIGSQATMQCDLLYFL